MQLAWAAELARELGARGDAASIEALKFRAPLRPGDPYALRVERAEAGGGFRFAIRRGEEAVSEGRWLEGELAEPEPAIGRAETAAPAGAPPLRIPQQGAMRLLRGVISHAGGATLCHARLGDDAPLARAGRAPVWLALELLAQGMAAQGGLALGDAAPRRAFVVGARRIALRVSGLPLGVPLWVRVDHQRGETGFVVCDAALGPGDPPATGEAARARAWADGRLTAFVESATRSSPSEEET